VGGPRTAGCTMRAPDFMRILRAGPIHSPPLHTVASTVSMTRGPPAVFSTALNCHFVHWTRSQAPALINWRRRVRCAGLPLIPPTIPFPFVPSLINSGDVCDVLTATDPTCLSLPFVPSLINGGDVCDALAAPRNGVRQRRMRRRKMMFYIQAVPPGPHGAGSRKGFKTKHRQKWLKTT
jgi:hypothetical protein